MCQECHFLPGPAFIKGLGQKYLWLIYAFMGKSCLTVTVNVSMSFDCGGGAGGIGAEN